jgi:hypothetical protein
MRYEQAVSLLSSLLIASSISCVATEHTSADPAKREARAMEVPVTPDGPAAVQESAPSDVSGEVQERRLMHIAPGVLEKRPWWAPFRPASSEAMNPLSHASDSRALGGTKRFDAV